MYVHRLSYPNVSPDSPNPCLFVHAASTFPHGRMLHYWAKSTLFGHPLAKYILTNAGNIPVNRKVRDNQVLFRGTFDALAVGDVVAIFPEGAYWLLLHPTYEEEYF